MRFACDFCSLSLALVDYLWVDLLNLWVSERRPKFYTIIVPFANESCSKCTDAKNFMYVSLILEGLFVSEIPFNNL